MKSDLNFCDSHNSSFRSNKGRKCLKQQNSLGFYGTFAFQSAKLLWQCFPLIPNKVLSYIFLDFENIQMYQAIISTNVKLNGPKQVLLRSDNKVLEKKNNNFQMKSNFASSLSEINNWPVLRALSTLVFLKFEATLQEGVL